ncbi:ester hydrolase C11orf54 homolog isoform X3 [Daktulosphaira vitifoliae]|uniref:ester hydrolase C11orf54 homolog isoform X3 n=1 Tax=Daktulosphaira vitifoliae TaxID=58002 RepID=UPI0021AA0DDA|nr:ester hydrolase C11orf54 homolog isoform X3 [Daktulosphaira vitifoliae]
MNELHVKKIKLIVPSLNEINEVILPELSKNFKRVSIEIVQCPDLTQSPFFLVSEGLSGNENIIDVGSPSYLFPIVNKDKVYKFEDLQQITGSDQIFIIGASGSAWPYHGEVLRIECEKRIGPLDFLTSIRQALTKFYGNKLVGLGGVILIETGKVKVHVMPEFSKTPINSEDDLNKWLKFFEIPTPLVGLGYFVSHDPGLDLRLQHFHLYSEHGVGGHYRCDTEPATIKYTAYLNVANNLYRVDQPDGNYSSN